MRATLLAAVAVLGLTFSACLENDTSATTDSAAPELNAAEGKVMGDACCAGEAKPVAMKTDACCADEAKAAAKAEGCCAEDGAAKAAHAEEDCAAETCVEKASGSCCMDKAGKTSKP